MENESPQQSSEQQPVNYNGYLTYFNYSLQVLREALATPEGRALIINLIKEAKSTGEL